MSIMYHREAKLLTWRVLRISPIDLKTRRLFKSNEVGARRKESVLAPGRASGNPMKREKKIFAKVREEEPEEVPYRGASKSFHQIKI